MATNNHIRYKTYNNVVDTLKCIGEIHEQIKTVSCGDIFEMDLDKMTLFPLMHINPVNVQANKQHLVLNFQIFVSDLVEPHLSNEQEVLSDTMEICLDLISLYKHSDTLNFDDTSNTGTRGRRYWVESDYTLEPFTERFENALTGWVFNLAITIEEIYSACDVPLKTDAAGNRYTCVDSKSII